MIIGDSILNVKLPISQYSSHFKALNNIAVFPNYNYVPQFHMVLLVYYPILIWVGHIAKLAQSLPCPGI